MIIDPTRRSYILRPPLVIRYGLDTSESKSFKRWELEHPLWSKYATHDITLHLSGPEWLIKSTSKTQSDPFLSMTCQTLWILCYFNGQSHGSCVWPVANVPIGDALQLFFFLQNNEAIWQKEDKRTILKK